MADLPKPKIVPPLDPEFRPAALAHPQAGVTCVIGLHRADGTGTSHEVLLGPDQELNALCAERTVKFLLWQCGGHRVSVGGPAYIFNHIRERYRALGARSFDCDLVGLTVFERDIEVVHCAPEDVPAAVFAPRRIGRHLDGCRIGFDLGASDRKVAAVIDGEEVFSEETVWDPQGNSDPEYHYSEIKAGLESARAHLPRLDAIGGSSAGVVVDNRVMVASIFRGVSHRDYPRAREVFLRLSNEYEVPLEVANDGDVTALAGAMSLDEGRVLGIAMGSSEAAGFVDAGANITGWLNELAFAPIDYSPTAPQDEWSKDIGCGVQYLSQQAVFRLAAKAGIDLDATDVLAEKLEIAQVALRNGHAGARQVWESMGVYFGYAIAHYAAFYDVRHVLVLGRVTSGEGGAIIVENAVHVMKAEFPELAERVKLSLPDEKTRRVGQAVAAASLPVLPRGQRS
jgi:predicted NBD/HSP70 family sugar kinase